MRTIKASEFVSYTYCQRAWWYQAKGVPSENQAEMLGGSEFHRRYGKQILITRWMEMMGWCLVLAALGLGAAALTLLSFQ